MPLIFTVLQAAWTSLEWLCPEWWLHLSLYLNNHATSSADLAWNHMLKTRQSCCTVLHKSIGCARRTVNTLTAEAAAVLTYRGVAYCSAGIEIWRLHQIGCRGRLHRRWVSSCTREGNTVAYSLQQQVWCKDMCTCIWIMLTRLQWSGISCRSFYCGKHELTLGP